MVLQSDIHEQRRSNPPTYETIPIGWIRPAKRNARKHSASQVDDILKSMNTAGAINPPIVDETYRLIAGEGRWLALKKLGVVTAEVIVVRHLSEAQKRAYAIADNRLAEKSAWDWSALQLELHELHYEMPELDLSATGFNHAQIEQMVAKLYQVSWSDLDQPMEPDAEAIAITQLHDRWMFEGGSALVCGDSTDRRVVWSVMGEDRAQQAVTDPPFNRDTATYSGKGQNKHGNFAMGYGELDRRGFVMFLRASVAAIKPHLVEGALLDIFMDWQHVSELLDAGREEELELRNLLVWDKGKGGMGSLYRSGHELICLFKHGSAPHVNNIKLGANGRDRSNVLRYAGMNSFGGGRDRALASHPTSKPVQLLADLMLDTSNIGDIVYDGFGGSGSTLIAAHKMERRARLVELSPVYCDTIVARFVRAFGSEPVLADDDSPQHSHPRAIVHMPHGAGHRIGIFERRGAIWRHCPRSVVHVPGHVVAEPNRPARRLIGRPRNRGRFGILCAGLRQRQHMIRGEMRGSKRYCAHHCFAIAATPALTAQRIEGCGEGNPNAGKAQHRERNSDPESGHMMRIGVEIARPPPAQPACPLPDRRPPQPQPGQRRNQHRHAEPADHLPPHARDHQAAVDDVELTENAALPNRFIEHIRRIPLQPQRRAERPCLLRRALGRGADGPDQDRRSLRAELQQRDAIVGAELRLHLFDIE